MEAEDDEEEDEADENRPRSDSWSLASSTCAATAGEGSSETGGMKSSSWEAGEVAKRAPSSSMWQNC